MMFVGLISDDDGSLLINFDKFTTDTRFLENEFFTLLPTEPVQDSSKVYTFKIQKTATPFFNYLN